MHVAGAADRRQQDVQIPSIFSDLGLSLIDLKLGHLMPPSSPTFPFRWWRHFVG
jgi:hypothetical protein